MRKLSTVLALAVGLTFFQAQASRPEPKPSQIAEGHTGPHGGEVLQDGKYEFEVTVNRAKNQVDVLTLRRGPEVPQQMSITLYTDPHTGQKIDLRAQNPQVPMPVYQGQLALGAENFMGIELHFDTESTGPQVIKTSKVP